MHTILLKAGRIVVLVVRIAYVIAYYSENLTSFVVMEKEPHGSVLVVLGVT